MTNPTDLNFAPGVKFQGQDAKPNVLTHALQLVLPHRVSPQMREGLREPDDRFSQLTRTSTPTTGFEEINNPSLTNEQIAEIAVQRAMGMHR